MKNSFSYRSLRTPSSGRNHLILVTFLVISLIGIDALLHGAIRNKVHVGVALISGWVEQAGNIIGGGSLFSFGASENENSLRIERLRQSEERAAAYEALKRENDELRAFLSVVGDASDPDKKTGITAPIVSSVRSSPYGTFLIGAGSADGIVSGSVVLTSTGFVVGIVGSPGLHTAVVREIFAPGASTEVTIRDVPGIARGFGGGNARITIPRGLLIAVGDPVIAPGLGQRPIGTVGEVYSNSASASEEIYVRLPVNLASLSFVYVIPFRN